MARNQDYYQKGHSLIELFNEYETEVRHVFSLFSWKWLQDYRCPECSSTRYFTIKSRKIYQSNYCHYLGDALSLITEVFILAALKYLKSNRHRHSKLRAVVIV